MPSIRDFFEQEARDYLRDLERIAELPEGASAPEELQRAARALRGSAQMAREGRVQEVAGALEGAARALSRGTLEWSDGVRDRVRRTIDDLQMLIAAEGAPDELEERVAAGVARWSELGVETASPGFNQPGPVVAQTPAESSDDHFLRYAATEVSSIVAELDASMPELERHPRSSEAFAPVLRRSGALLGAAQLRRLGAVADVLRALDEVGRMAPRLSSALDGDIIELVRSARDALAGGAPTLRQGTVPAAGADHGHVLDLRERIAERRDESTPSPGTAAPAEEEFPVEVVNFFRSESREIITRVERIADELRGAAGDRVGALREDVKNALSALRDTATTFGFNAAAKQAGSAVERAGTAAADELRGLATQLRAVIDRPDAAASAEPEAPTLSAPVGMPEPAAPPESAEPEPIAAAAAPDRAPAPLPEPLPAVVAGEEVSIDALLYSGESARDRAREVVAEIRRMLDQGGDAGALLEELDDLIVLAGS